MIFLWFSPFSVMAQALANFKLPDRIQSQLDFRSKFKSIFVDKKKEKRSMPKIFVVNIQIMPTETMITG